MSLLELLQKHLTECSMNNQSIILIVLYLASGITRSIEDSMSYRWVYWWSTSHNVAALSVVQASKFR